MIPFIIATIPVEIPVEPFHPIDWTDVNRAAQLDTKERYPWWWERHGGEGVGWYPVGEQCIDLTQ